MAIKIGGNTIRKAGTAPRVLPPKPSGSRKSDARKAERTNPAQKSQENVA